MSLGLLNTLLRNGYSVKRVRKREINLYSRVLQGKDIVVVSYPKNTTISGPVQELINQNILKYSSVISIYDSKILSAKIFATFIIIFAMLTYGM